jgi:hypothetical protein
MVTPIAVGAAWLLLLAAIVVARLAAAARRPESSAGCQPDPEAARDGGDVPGRFSSLTSPPDGSAVRGDFWVDRP